VEHLLSGRISKSGREFSGKLAKDLRRGQVRIDSLDKELLLNSGCPWLAI